MSKILAKLPRNLVNKINALKPVTFSKAVLINNLRLDATAEQYAALQSLKSMAGENSTMIEAEIMGWIMAARANVDIK
jgi:hypothetical protein